MHVVACGVSIDDYYFFAEAELADVIVAVTQPTLSALPAPLATTLAMLLPPHRALQVRGLLRLKGLALMLVGHFMCWCFCFVPRGLLYGLLPLVS